MTGTGNHSDSGRDRAVARRRLLRTSIAAGVAVAVTGVAGTGAVAVGLSQHRYAVNGTASYDGTGISDDSGSSDDGGTQQQQQPGIGVPGGSLGQSSSGGSHGS
jgi:hypothetical protein